MLSIPTRPVFIRPVNRRVSGKCDGHVDWFHANLPVDVVFNLPQWVVLQRIDETISLKSARFRFWTPGEMSSRNASSEWIPSVIWMIESKISSGRAFWNISQTSASASSARISDDSPPAFETKAALTTIHRKSGPKLIPSACWEVRSYSWAMCKRGRTNHSMRRKFDKGWYSLSHNCQTCLKGLLL